MTTTRHRRAATAAMVAGLALTAAAAIIPHVDRATADVLADHIRSGYPSYSEARIDEAATLYLIYLSALGVLGIASWSWLLWAVARGKRWAPAAATSVFALATAIAVFNLLVKDTSGDTGLPPLLGVIGLAPSAAGLLAVVLLWRRA